MDINVEIFFTTLGTDKVFFLKKITKLPTYEQNPSIYVEKIISKLEKSGILDSIEKVINHSTSWRFSENSIILSFLVYSDFFKVKPKHSVSFSDLSMNRAISNINPEPKSITDTNVISHALKHLNFLLKENKDSYKKIILPETIDLLNTITKVY